jgi:hypothetical protein
LHYQAWAFAFVVASAFVAFAFVEASAFADFDAFGEFAGASAAASG